MLITPSSPLESQLSSASSDAMPRYLDSSGNPLPYVPTTLPPIPPQSAIVGDINTAHLTSYYFSVLPYHSDWESPDPPAPIQAFTPPGTSEASTPQIPARSYVKGPFRVWRVLSKGGFAKAMGAQDLATNRLICLKVFRKDRLKRRNTEEVILNELEVYKRLASLSRWCPETIFLMGLEMSFQTNDHICFAMDLMAGDLRHLMTHSFAYCTGNACRWSAQLALGINALHELGIIHRDIKPENILIDSRENVRIADFGLSHMDVNHPLYPWNRCASDVVGTTYCMAPEVLRNMKEPCSEKYGTPVDWWAFGCVMYELASPHHRSLFDTEEDIMNYVFRRPFSSIQKLLPGFKDLHPFMVDLAGGLLEPCPGLRYEFPEVRDHKCFVKKDGTSEFHDACSRSLRREEQPHTLPVLWDEQTQTEEIWCPISSWKYRRMDWMKPRWS